MQNKPVPPSTRQAVQAFIQLAAEQYPVSRAILFGSRARGTERPDSDADVAVLLKGHGHFLRTKMAMADMAFDVMLDTGIRIQALPIWEDEWSHPEKHSNPDLLKNIALEGIPL
jgi:predicted nucleotidyltransferase